MILGYALIGQDNDSFMFDPDDKDLPICSSCGYVTNIEYISPLFKLSKKKYDVSYTYDGCCIVSEKFKDFCVRRNYKGIDFRNLPNDPHFYSFLVHNIVNINTKEQKINYNKYCNTCGNYKSVTPGFPLFLKDDTSVLRDRFYATDIHFGSESDKCPIFVVAPDTYLVLKGEKFKGLVFEKVETRTL